MTEEKTTIDLAKLKEGSELVWADESKHLQERHGVPTFIRVAEPANGNFNAILLVMTKVGEIRFGTSHFDFEDY